MLFFLELSDFFREEVLALFDQLDHVLVAGVVDGVKQGSHLAVEVEQAGLLVAKLHVDKLVAHY